MNSSNTEAISNQIIKKAKKLGASLAGIASVELLKKSPSHDIYSKIEQHKGIGARKFEEGVKPGEIAWPPETKSVAVIALSHKEDEPEFDWWKGDSSDRKSAGNHVMSGIMKDLSEWVEEEFNIKTHRLPYHIERGSIFLKDSAVMAGFGCIGKNNLVVTPEFGPRVRFWALLLDEEVTPTGPMIFDPCDGCSEPCRNVCPQNAFDGIVYSPIEIGMVTLPGRNGCYSRDLCKIHTKKNVDDAEIVGKNDSDDPIKCIKFCRLCELSCPVGK